MRFTTAYELSQLLELRPVVTLPYAAARAALAKVPPISVGQVGHILPAEHTEIGWNVAKHTDHELPAAGAPLGKVRPFRAEGRVAAVARVHPRRVGQLREDPLFQVRHEAVEALGVLFGVPRAAGE